MLGRSGLDLSGLGGKGEPEESHQESRQTDKQYVDLSTYVRKAVRTERLTYGKPYVRKDLLFGPAKIWSMCITK